MTLEEIQNKLKSLGLDELLTKTELKHLPAILLDDEEILYAFDTRDIHWLGILTQYRIIRLRNTSLSGLKTKIIELKNITSIQYKDGIIMDKIILNSQNNEQFNLEICFKINAYAMYYGIEAIIKGNNPKDAIRNSKTHINKPPCERNFLGYGIVFAIFIILSLMLKSCFFDESENDKAINSIIQNIPNKASQWGKPHLIKVSEKEIGDEKYPFKVKEGYIICSEVNSNQYPNSHHPHVLFFNPAKGTYHALSGSARERSRLNCKKVLSYQGYECEENRKCSNEWNCFNYSSIEEILKYNRWDNLVSLCNDWYDINVHTYLDNVINGFHYKNKDFNNR